MVLCCSAMSFVRLRRASMGVELFDVGGVRDEQSFQSLLLLPQLPLAVGSSFWIFRGLAPCQAKADATVQRPGCRRQVDLGSFRPSSLHNCNYRQEHRVP